MVPRRHHHHRPPRESPHPPPRRPPRTSTRALSGAWKGRTTRVAALATLGGVYWGTCPAREALGAAASIGLRLWQGGVSCRWGRAGRAARAWRRHLAQEGVRTLAHALPQAAGVYPINPHSCQHSSTQHPDHPSRAIRAPGVCVRVSGHASALLQAAHHSVLHWAALRKPRPPRSRHANRPLKRRHCRPGRDTRTPQRRQRHMPSMSDEARRPGPAPARAYSDRD